MQSQQQSVMLNASMNASMMGYGAPMAGNPMMSPSPMIGGGKVMGGAPMMGSGPMMGGLNNPYGMNNQSIPMMAQPIGGAPLPPGFNAPQVY